MAHLTNSMVSQQCIYNCQLLYLTKYITKLTVEQCRTSNSSSNTRGAEEEPSLKVLRSAKLQCKNSSPISNYQRSKSAIFILRNINYNINSLLQLHIGTHIIYIYVSRLVILSLNFKSTDYGIYPIYRGIFLTSLLIYPVFLIERKLSIIAALIT